MHIKNKKIIIPAVAVLAALIVSGGILSAFSGKTKPELAGFYRGAPISVKPEVLSGELSLGGEGFEAIAENDRYLLELDASGVLFRITDKSTDKFWLNGFPPDEYGEDVIPKIRREMRTICNVSYTNYLGDEGVMSNAADEVETVFRRLKNGIEFEFTYPEQEISVAVQMYLDDTGFRARIPREKLRETGDYRIVQIDLLPAFGSVLQNTQGYILYPDGSGTLYECAGIGSVDTLIHSQEVYCSHINDLDAASVAKSHGHKSILLPYFGATDSSKGFIAYIEDGSEDARETFISASAMSKLNRIYSSMVYRKITTRTGPDKKELYVTERTSTAGDFCVKYILLNQESADYSGMSIALRNFLQSTGRMTSETIESGKPIPLSLEILTGTMEKTLGGENSLAMTTYKQAEKMLKTLTDNQVDSIYTVLMGWQKEGYPEYPAGSKASAALGGANDLKRLLSAYTGKYSTVFLLTNYLNAQQDSRGFNKKRDAVFTFVDLPLSNREGTEFLLNPFLQYNKLKKDLGQYLEYGAKGLAFDGIGEVLTADYEKNRKLTRKDSKMIYSSMLKLSQDKKFTVAVQKGNDYMLPYADYVYNLYEDDSNLFAFTREIPFYQMVVHGYLPYSGDLPGNMSSDFQRQKLKWVEYGSVPYFIVSEKPSNDLKDTGIYDVFSSRFSDWKDVILNTCKEFNQRLTPVFGLPILSHKNISPLLIEVTYQSNYKVYINYDSSAAQVGQLSIPAMDYIVVNP